MTEEKSGIFVLRDEDAVHIRVSGRGSFQNSQALRTFTGEMIGRGYLHFVLDLAKCSGMDSTFLGVLTGLGLSLQRKVPPGKVHVVNASDHSIQLLKSLWLDRLFQVIDSGRMPPQFSPSAAVAFRVLPNSDLSDGGKLPPGDESLELVLTAHEDLIRADRRNEQKFAVVTKLLRQEADET